MRDRQENQAPTVWLVIVNYNSHGDTADCLRSLATASWPDLRIVLVDNGSIDGSGDRLRDEFPDVTHLRSAENLGFAAGCNLGIRHALAAHADYICLLNNDTIVESGFLEPLVARAAAGQRMERELAAPGARVAGTRRIPAIVGGKILYDEPEAIIWFAGGQIDRRTGVTTHRGQDMPDSPTYNEPAAVDYITGCLFLAPAKLFSQLGLLDERLFMYCEELDFCLRARSAGYECFYEPAAVIRHRVSRSMGGAYRPDFYYYQTRNLLMVYQARLRTARFSVPMVKLFMSLVIHQSYIMLRAHRVGARPYICAIWSGFTDYLAGNNGRRRGAPMVPEKNGASGT